MQTSNFSPPSLSLPDLSAINWSSPADMIRFRAESRPRQLLEEPLLIRWFGKRQVALISDPVAADEVLFKKSNQFPKAAVQQKLGHAAFGPGLSGTAGTQNRRQRRAFSPLMSERQASVMKSVAEQATKAALTRWLEAGTIDVAYEMAELALQIIWATLLGPGIYEGRDCAVQETVQGLNAHARGDFIAAAGIVRRLAHHFEVTGRWKRLQDDNPLAAITRPQGWNSRNLVLSQEEIRANAVVLAASGHVTTGLTLAWVTWLLGLYPEHQERCRLEADRGESDGQHSFLRQVVKETLRLMPPGAEAMRDAETHLHVAGEDIEPGAIVLVSFYAMHRHRRHWHQPDAFVPDRFAPGSPEPVMRSAYLPFSAGPAGCSGALLAWAEILSVMDSVLRETRINVDVNLAAKVGLTAGTCIYPSEALYVQLSPR